MTGDPFTKFPNAKRRKRWSLMTEQELMDSLVEADKELEDARRSLTDAKKHCTEAETTVINAKLHKERLVEELRVLNSRKVIPGEDYSLFDDEDSSR